MAENVAAFHRRLVAVEEMQVGAADRAGGDLDYRIAGVLDLRIGDGVDANVAFPVPAKCAHVVLQLRSCSVRRGDGFHRDAGGSEGQTAAGSCPPRLWLRFCSRRLRIIADGPPCNVVPRSDRDVAIGVRWRHGIRISRAGRCRISGSVLRCFVRQVGELLAKRPPGSSRNSSPGSSFITGTMPGAASSKPGCTGRCPGVLVARRRRLRILDLCAAFLDELPGADPMFVVPALRLASASQMAWATRASRHWRVYRPERSFQLLLRGNIFCNAKKPGGFCRRENTARGEDALAAVAATKSHSIGFPPVTGITAPEM